MVGAIMLARSCGRHSEFATEAQAAGQVGIW